MADFNLGAMAKAAGVNVNKLLAAIEQTRAHEDELYAIIFPVVQAYFEAIGYVEERWVQQTLTKSVVEGVLATAAGYGIRAVLLAEPEVGDWAQRVEKWHRTRWVGVIRGGTRLDVSAILAAGDVRKVVEAATANNISLIRGLSDEAYKRIEQTVWRAYADGTGREQLGKTLREQMGFGKARARLIARDQLGKYSGALDRARQEQAGITSYVWKTVGDDRVRKTSGDNHVRANGKRFLWAKPPTNPKGHPGQPIQCRCKAKAVVLTDAEEAEVERILAEAG